MKLENFKIPSASFFLRVNLISPSGLFQPVLVQTGHCTTDPGLAGESGLHR